MNRNISSEYGQIKIHKRAIRQLAEATAKQIKGVKAVGWECYRFKRLLRFFDWAGTRIIFDNDMRIVIPVVISWEQNIVDVAYEIQKSVISQMLTGLNIDSLSVDIKVKKVERG
ncbi:MAG: Asp23/Gls24 family envelope stress response protein [Candidatus Omnitrophica bacterium]|nr:Asp23/Gls24 family envelope stress response protein [Candidatus Omnitrophota bacterium]